MSTTTINASIFKRRNGAYGASFDGCQDTGHAIHCYNGGFTVWSIHEPETIICDNVTRAEAEAAIAQDWDAMP